MKEVIVTEVDAYSWDYPDCGHYNCHDKHNDLVCDDCGGEFELGKVEN